MLSYLSIFKNLGLEILPPDFNFGAHDWIIKPSRSLLGLMINKCFLNTQI
jgi:hypothetical protein